MTIAVLGEALIDLIAGDDGAYRPHLGGSPFNVAIGLARQGIDVTYLASLSDDSFGDALLDALHREGVDVPARRRSLWPTSLALVTVNAQGQPSYRLYREGIADKDTSVEEIIDSLPEKLEVFHTGSLAITPSQLPKITTLMQQLRERGICISMDINIRLRASIDQHRYLAGVRSLLPLADIVKASDEDIDVFALSPNVREAAAILHSEMTQGILVLTEGDGGALLLGHAPNVTSVETRAYPVAEVCDTVGAGDTFHAAFLAYLCRKDLFGRGRLFAEVEHVGAALDFACAAAALNVSRKGCSPPIRAEVERFIDAAKR